MMNGELYLPKTLQPDTPAMYTITKALTSPKTSERAIENQTQLQQMLKAKRLMPVPQTSIPSYAPKLMLILKTQASVQMREEDTNTTDITPNYPPTLTIP